MAEFRYTARTSQGEQIGGAIEATSQDDALAQLRARGLQDVHVTHAPDVPGAPADDRPELGAATQPPAALSPAEASELAGHMAQVAATQLPLAAGLRAAAEETGSRRVAAALLWIADQVEQGRSLEDTLEHSGQLLPAHVTGLILAASRTGQLGEALFELVEQQQIARSLHYDTRGGLAYVAIMLLLAAAVLTFICYYVADVIRQMLLDFDRQLPMVTQALFWWRDYGILAAGGVALVLASLAVAYRVVAGRVRWERLLSSLPLFGTLWQSIAVADWAGLVSVLLRHEIPLPDALRMAGHGIGSQHVGSVSLHLADGVARGRQLSQLMFSQTAIPPSLIPLVEWGERSKTLSEAFRIGREMYGKRAVMRAALIQAVFPPLVMVGVGCIVLFVLFGLYTPMFNLIVDA
ncbi:MAG: type II secretion system F family protein [Planctomycetaceae bacterium]|nr:type II secretion system F family protein [Planctomycetaceae bacterium]